MHDRRAGFGSFDPAEEICSAVIGRNGDIEGV
jgi:hypothetical protein